MMTEKVKISAVIISKNEEKNIARCIDSLFGVADEIIVVDSFSDDRTEEICRSRNVKFVHKAWMGYSETKNYANTLAGNNYILSIDADEALSEDLRNEIINLKNKGLDSRAYKIKRLTSYCGKWIRHCGWYPDWKVRLWEKGTGKWEGMIHEKVVFSEPVKAVSLKSDLLHFSYDSIEDHIRQMSNFSNIMAQESFLKNKRPVPLKMFLSPVCKFIKAFVLQRGFLDGYYGFVVCTFSAMATFMKYAKIEQLFRQQDNN